MLKGEILKTLKANQVNPKYNISKSELKDIKRNLYNIEKQRKIILKKTSKYLDELDERILRLDKYHDLMILNTKE